MLGGGRLCLNDCACCFFDCDIRRAPRKVPDALAASGGLIASLYLMFLEISIIDFWLNLTGLSKFGAQILWSITNL